MTEMQQGWTSVPGPDTIVRKVLDNGIVCLVQEKFASPSVVVRGRLRAGSLVVPRAKAGLAGYLADMLGRGTERRDFATLNEEIESVGASLDFDSDWQSTSFKARCLSEDLSLIWDILADCLRRPTLPEDQMNKVRGELLTALEQREHDTRRKAILNFYETMYADHPMGISGVGYEDSVQSITARDLRAYYDDYYRPDTMVVTMVGGVQADRAIAMVEAALGDWRIERPAPMPVIPMPEQPNEVLLSEVEIPGKTQADFVLGRVGLERNHPDYMTARLANTILGVFGMMGRIGDNVRERLGLAYYAYSALVTGFMPGPWLAIAGVNPANLDKAIDATLEEIKRMRNELVPEEELAENKAYLVGSMPLVLETNAGVAATLQSMEVYQLGLDYLLRYPNMIHNITAQDIQRVVREVWDPDAYALAIAKPR